MFAISFVLAAPNHILMDIGWENLQSYESITWGIVPIIATVLIVVVSSLLKEKNFDRTFKVFLFVVAASIVLMFVPVPATTFLPPVVQTITAVAIVASACLYLKRRETSNLMFLLTMACFASAGIGVGIGLATYFNTFAYAFAYGFLGLVFVTSKENMSGDITSVFSLKNELQTTQKEMQMPQERLTKIEPIFANSKDAIILVDTKGNIVDCNQTTLDLLRLPTKKESAISKNVTLFVASKEQQKILNKLTEVLDAESFLTGEITVLTEGGFEFPIEFYVNAIKGESGNAKGFVIIAHDITKRKQMEKELSRYSEKLEDLVEKRTKALKESQELLVKSERLAAIGQAATMVGHDLRNPLQAIENAAYYLNNEFSKIPDSSKLKETVKVIHRSIDYADNIVNDLLCFASTRKAVFMETDINDLIKETLLQISIPKNVKIVTELDEIPKIVGDKQMLKRVFVNIAVNGIQAIEEKAGTLRVSTKKVGECIEVKITDNGIGIKEECMKKIYTPFFTTKAQGMGVGLAICKRFVEINEGTIEVESKEGEGSTFTIKLPINGMEVKKSDEA